MGKIRDLLKKTRHIKVTFQANMGTKKDRNVMDLTETKQNIKKRWQEYTELYKKKIFMTQITTRV